MRPARTSIALAVLSTLVTTASFGSQVIIARAFGASRTLDGYLQSTSIPFLVAGTIAGVFSYALVPALTRVAANRDELARISGAFLWTLSAIAVSIAVAGWFISPTIVDAMSVGQPAVGFSTAVLIARIAWIAAAFNVSVGFAAALLNVHGRFFAPVASATLPYIGSAVAVMVIGPQQGAISIVVGLLVGTILNAVLLAIASWRLVRLRALSDHDFLPVCQFGRVAPAAFVSALTFAVYQSVDSFWAPQLGPSNLSVLGYCQRLLVALGTISIAGPSLILQPRLATAATSGDAVSFARDLERAIRLTVVICTPVALWVSWLAGPIVRIAFERGLFDRTVTLDVAELLPYMLIGMIPMLCTVMIFRALYACSDVRTAAILGIVGPLLYFVLSGLLLSQGVVGIGISYALTWSALVYVGAYRVFGSDYLRADASSFAVQLSLTLATTFVSAILSLRFLGDWQQHSTFVVFARLAVAAFFSTASYVFVALKIARVYDLQLLADALLPKVWRGVEER